jgi:PAS domain S-box-containing protein
MPEGANLIVWRTKEKTFTESLPEIMPVIAEKALCLLMQREMEAEREMNSMIMNNSRSMLSIINRNYVYEKVNARFCDTHATDNVSVEGQPLTELWGEENFMTNIKPRIDRCLKGETVRYEATFATRGGGSRSYDIVFRPFYSLGNEVDHILAESFDITEFRDTESALREIETEFRKLETNLPVGYVRCNTEGAVLHLNKACHNIFDLPSPPPSGLNIKDLYSDGGLFFLHLKQLEDSHVKLLGITRFRSLTGKELSCRLTGFLTDSGDGRYFDLAIEDITREIYLERRLLQAHRLETVGALAGGIAHDFNNILTTIYGYAELSMEDTGDNPLLHDNLARIISAVARARSLTGQILTFSRQIEQEKVR